MSDLYRVKRFIAHPNENAHAFVIVTVEGEHPLGLPVARKFDRLEDADVPRHPSRMQYQAAIKEWRLGWRRTSESAGQFELGTDVFVEDDWESAPVLKGILPPKPFEPRKDGPQLGMA